MKKILKQILLFLVLAATTMAADSTRKIISLNGMWEIEQTKGGDLPPTHYTAKAPVPGLVDIAIPAFAEGEISNGRLLDLGG